MMTACVEGKCSISLPTPSSEVACIGGSKYQGHHDYQQKLADCIVFWSPGSKGDILAPIELKGGHVSASQAISQLQNAATVAQSLLGTAFAEIRFRPILVHRGGIHPNEYRILRSRRVRFREFRVLASPVRSGTSLAKAVS